MRRDKPKKQEYTWHFHDSKLDKESTSRWWCVDPFGGGYGPKRRCMFGPESCGQKGSNPAHTTDLNKNGCAMKLEWFTWLSVRIPDIEFDKLTDSLDLFVETSELLLVDWTDWDVGISRWEKLHEWNNGHYAFETILPRILNSGI